MESKVPVRFVPSHQVWDHDTVRSNVANPLKYSLHLPQRDLVEDHLCFLQDSWNLWMRESACQTHGQPGFHHRGLFHSERCISGPMQWYNPKMLALLKPFGWICGYPQVSSDPRLG